jgi:hypothetical protein
MSSGLFVGLTVPVGWTVLSGGGWVVKQAGGQILRGPFVPSGPGCSAGEPEKGKKKEEARTKQLRRAEPRGLAGQVVSASRASATWLAAVTGAVTAPTRNTEDNRRKGRLTGRGQHRPSIHGLVREYPARFY